MIVESLLIGAFLLFFVCYALALIEPYSRPHLYAQDLTSKFVQEIVKACPIFTEPYVPTYLWGKNGHLQTLVYSKLRPTKCISPDCVRKNFETDDGATLTYDVFQPFQKHSADDVTILVCPGLANNSESTYVSSFAHFSQECGFRVVVLNSIGTLDNVQLTSPRIFTYGGTDDLHHVATKTREEYPETKLVLVGFSMGGNVILKYLGQQASHDVNILCGISLCQGYDANKARPLLRSWSNMRCVYLHAMAAAMKGLLNRHRGVLLTDTIMEQYSLDEKAIFSSTTIVEFDEHYSRKTAGFASVEKYYEWCSCGNYLQNIQVPILLVNSEDDPLVPPELCDIAIKHAESTTHCLSLITKHGGHLGFFEGGFIFPNTVTWCDKAVLQFANAIVSLHKDGKLQKYNMHAEKENGFTH